MTEKRCGKCHEIKALDDFYRDRSKGDGHATICKACRRIYDGEREKLPEVKQARLQQSRQPNRRAQIKAATKQRELTHPEQNRARQSIRALIKKSLIIRPGRCSCCHNTSLHIEAHHPDYNKPLEVIWLCKRCHALANIGAITVSI